MSFIAKMNEVKPQTDEQIGGAGYNDKLLVVGYENGFSDFLMDYSIQMASRMNYSLVALNLFLVTQRRWLFSQVSQGKAGNEDIERISDESAGIFAGKADEANIEFERLFQTGHLDDVVRKVCKERGDIDLVLLEPEFLNIDPEDPFSIPAFSLAPDSS